MASIALLEKIKFCKPISLKLLLALELKADVSKLSKKGIFRTYRISIKEMIAKGAPIIIRTRSNLDFSLIGSFSIR